MKLCTLTISFDKDSSMQKVGSLYCPEVENLKREEGRDMSHVIQRVIGGGR